MDGGDGGVQDGGDAEAFDASGASDASAKDDALAEAAVPTGVPRLFALLPQPSSGVLIQPLSSCALVETGASLRRAGALGGGVWFAASRELAVPSMLTARGGVVPSSVWARVSFFSDAQATQPVTNCYYRGAATVDVRLIACDSGVAAESLVRAERIITTPVLLGGWSAPDVRLDMVLGSPGTCSAAGPASLVFEGTIEQGFMATTDELVTVRAYALGPLADVRWERGDRSGAFAPGNPMEARIPVNPGANTVVISANGPRGKWRRVFTVTRASRLVPTAEPSVEPKLAFSGNGSSEPVTVRVPLGTTIGPSPAPAIVRLDGGGETLGQLWDDGAAEHADERAGDGVWSARIRLTLAPGSRVILGAAATTAAGREITPIGIVEAVPTVTADDVKVVSALVERWQARLNAIPASASIELLVSEIQGAPGVTSVTQAQGSRSLLVEFANGIAAVVYGAAPGTRADVGNRKTVPAKIFAAELKPKDIDALVKEIQESKDDELAANDRDYELTPTLLDEQATVDSFLGLTTYGIVGVASHGESFAAKDGDAAEEILMTMTPKSVAETNDAQGERYRKWLAAKAIVVYDGTLAITSKFVRDVVPGRFDRSFVYFGSCRSAKYGKFATAFLSKGAAGYFGYSSYVDTLDAVWVGERLFRCAVGDKKADGRPYSLGECVRSDAIGKHLWYATISCAPFLPSSAPIKGNPKNLPAEGFYAACLDYAGNQSHYWGSDELTIARPCPADRPNWNAEQRKCTADTTLVLRAAGQTLVSDGALVAFAHESPCETPELELAAEGASMTNDLTGLRLRLDGEDLGSAAPLNASRSVRVTAARPLRPGLHSLAGVLGSAQGPITVTRTFRIAETDRVCGPPEPPTVSHQPTQIVPVAPPAPFVPSVPAVPAPVSTAWPVEGLPTSAGSVTALTVGPPPVALQTRGVDIVPVSVSSGDPHITTADGITWTSLALGEFVYARSEALELQARHDRVSGYAPWASFVTATALRVGGRKLEVRLPAAAGQPLVLLLDGQPLSLPSGTYGLGDIVLELQRDNELRVSVREPGVPESMRGTAAEWTSVRIGVRVESELVQPDPLVLLRALVVTMSTPPLDRYRGLLGTPNGAAGDELRVPTGELAGDIDAFSEAWRVTNRAESLFTYAPGEGPETFNRAQDELPPSPADLRGGNGGPNFVADLERILRERCGIDPANADPTLVLQLAFDRAAGRTEAELVASGLCYDERLGALGLGFRAAPAAAAALAFEGRVTLATGGAGLGGVSVLVRSPTLGGSVCSTITGPDGHYACVRAFDPSIAAELELEIVVAGRGASASETVRVTTPGLWQTETIKRDVSVAVTRSLRLRGRVLRPDGAPAAAAHVRMTNPEPRETRADENGVWEIVYVPPAELREGTLALEAADERFRDTGVAELPFALGQSGETVLERDLQLMADRPAVPRPVTSADARRVSFVGRVRNAFVEGLDRSLSGADVTVSAPSALAGNTCTTRTVGGGGWSCTAELAATGAFTAQVRVTGAGQATRSVEVGADALASPGGLVVVPAGELVVSPTTLALSGRVLAGGAPVPAAKVAVTWVERSIEVLTSADGTYAARLSLPDSVPMTAMLTFRATVEGPGGVTSNSIQVPLGSFTPNALNPLVQDIPFDQRAYRFAGRVVNALAQAAPVPGARVEIRRNEAIACSTVSDAQGLYSCDVAGIDETAQTFSYVVSGKGSLRIDGVVVTPSGSATSAPQLVARDLEISPTTLIVEGAVATAAGTSLAGRTVTATGLPTGYGASLTTSTDAAGRFQIVVAFANEDVLASASVAADDGVTRLTESVTAVLSAGVVTRVTRNFVFGTAPVQLAVSWSAEAPTGRLAGRRSAIAADADGKLYTVGVLLQPAPVAKLMVTDPTTRTVRVSPVDLPQYELPSDGAPLVPVVGQDGQGRVSVYVTSDGNQDGAATGGGRSTRAYVYALAADGTLKWSRPLDATHERVGPGVALGADGTIYAVSTQRSFDGMATLYALAPDDGRILASTSFFSGGELDSLPVVGGIGVIYVSVQGSVLAFDPVTLAPRWPAPAICDGRRTGFSLSVGRDSVTGADVVYASGSGLDGDRLVASMCAFDASGAFLWGVGSGVDEKAPVGATVIGGDGTLFVISDGADAPALLAVAPNDGRTLWSVVLAGVDAGGLRGTPAVGADGRVYLTAGNRLFAVDVQTRQAAVLDMPETGEVIGANVILTTNGSLHLVHDARIGNASRTSLKAISASSGGAAATPWPTFAAGSGNAGRRGP